MKDNIFDSETGSHIAFIENGKVYRTTDGREIGYVNGGNIYAPNGKFVAGLQHIAASAGETLPPEFKALL